MKTIIRVGRGLAGVFVLIYTLLSNYTLQAQGNESVYKSGDSPPEWFYQKRASYDFMKQTFFRVYGSDQEGWPHFVREAINLDAKYREYEKANGKPDYNLVNQFFLENDPVLKENPKVKYKEYRNFYESVLRNYYTIFRFRYPKTDNEGKLAPIKSNNSLWVRYAYKVTDYIPYDDKKMTASYHTAAEKEGMLPAILYMFAFQCPPVMLEWYFREVFPAVDHLFTIESVEEKQKMFESIYLHINRLLEKMDRERADVWSNTFNSFLESYEYRSFQDVPVFFRSGSFREIIYNYKTFKRDSTYAAIFNNHFSELLKGLSYTVPSKIYYHYTHEKPAQLTFVKNESGGVNFILYMDRSIPSNPYLERNNYRVTKSLDYSTAGIGMPSSEIKLDYLESSGGFDVFKGFYTNSKGEIDISNYIVALSHNQNNAIQNFTSRVKTFWETKNDIYFASEEVMVYVNYPPTLESDLRKAILEALKLTAGDYLRHINIVPEIYGMKYQKAVSYKYVLTAEKSSKDIPPDGKSEVDIAALLYRYDLNTEEKREPLAGLPVDFEIVESKGYRGGSLSATSALTDNNGRVSVKYTPPTTESLKSADKAARFAATIKITNKDHNLEELVYVTFTRDKGKTEAYPAAGVISDHAIVPPDQRYPALIKFRYEGDNLEPRSGEKITFTLPGKPEYATLRAVGEGSATGQSATGHTITAVTDNDGYAMVQYLYTSQTKPDKPITDIIEIESPNSAVPFTAKVSVGMNIVFETVENGYEGKGVINAGELIPLRVKIKDAWNPALDLMQIMDYWGAGALEGDTPLRIKLEVERLGSVPDYLLDHLQIERYPIEQPFKESMRVRTFAGKDEADKGRMNMLWMSQASTLSYQGYPCIRPQIAGTSYYEVRVTLIDNNGEPVFPVNHPASKAFLTITTGVDADLFKIFINLNPFGPHSTYTKALREALGYKYGTVVSIVDALDAINRGDTEGLYKLLFSEIKGALLDQTKKIGNVSEEMVDAYSNIAFAEKILYDIMQDETGPIARADDVIFNQLKGVFNSNPGRIVILKGDGKQRLLVEERAGANPNEADKPKQTTDPKQAANQNQTTEQKSAQSSKFKIAISGFEGLKKAATEAVRLIKGASEVPAREREFISDKKLNTVSYKNGNTTIYLIPLNYDARGENHTYLKIY